MKKGSKRPFLPALPLSTHLTLLHQQTQFPWKYHLPQITTSLYQLPFERHANTFSAAQPLDQRNTVNEVCVIATVAESSFFFFNKVGACVSTQVPLSLRPTCHSSFLRSLRPSQITLCYLYYHCLSALTASSQISV